jgi:hypothetical protein
MHCRKTWLVGSLAFFAAASAATSGHALEVTSRALLDSGDHDRHVPEPPARMSLTGGGGVVGFMDPDAQEYTSLGGTWDMRLTFGTRSILGTELAFLGSWRDIAARGLDSSAKLLGTGGEVGGRLNLLAGFIQPYLLGGVGYMRYRLVADEFNDSAVLDRDIVVHFPLATGVSVRLRGLVLDTRATVRPVLQSDLLDDGRGAMDSWGVNLNAGVEF